MNTKRCTVTHDHPDILSEHKSIQGYEQSGPERSIYQVIKTWLTRYTSNSHDALMHSEPDNCFKELLFCNENVGRQLLAAGFGDSRKPLIGQKQ